VSGKTGARVVEYTDPACPVAFSAEPVHRRLAWLFGDQLEWQRPMVVINDGRGTGGGPPRDRIAASRRRLHAQYGMPLDPDAPPPTTTIEASRLVVAARLRAPELELAVLRALRRKAMASGALDRASVEQLALGLGVAPDVIDAMEGPDVGNVLEADMEDARALSPTAKALSHRLGGRGTRYSTPSYRYEAMDRRFELVGIHPVEAHEAILANLSPELARRPDPASAEEVLAWASEPLATAEVAAVMNVSIEDARERLTASASFHPAGLDGYWSF
jgi:hypothetical protein